MNQPFVLRTPWNSFEDINQQLLELHEAGNREIECLFPIESSEFLLELLQIARKHRISVAGLHTNRAKFLRGPLGSTPLEEIYRPNDPLFFSWVPLKQIVLSEHLDYSCSSGDFIGSVDSIADAVKRYSNDYYVDFIAELTFSHIDAAVLSRLCEQLVSAGFSKIKLEFSFPSPSDELLKTLREQLAEFSKQQIASHEAIRILGLPFCLLPASFFRPLYRQLYDSIPSAGHFQRQRLTIHQIRTTKAHYYPVCSECRRRPACYALTKVGSFPEYQRYLNPSSESTIVFVGASLTKADIAEHSLDDIVFTTPAQQGDGIMAILEGFKTIILLDGYFFQKYALTTFEVLTALVENVNVFGSSSLGALRGIELANYGMRASGYVYDFLRKHCPTPYHMVAQSYDEQNRPVTQALVAISRFLDFAVEEEIITSIVRDFCFQIAEDLHFSQMTFDRLFEEWADCRDITHKDTDALRDFLVRTGEDTFDVKRKDALLLLASFRDRIRADGPNYPARSVLRAREKYMSRLRLKFLDSYDSSLPNDWAEPIKGMREAMKRERSLTDTLRLAKGFFGDLDVVVADTSLLDKTNYFMINVIFVPFYFLGWGNSVGSGYGESREKALAAAYGEVLERIPAGNLRTNYIDIDKVTSRKFPFLNLPFFQSIDQTTLRRFVGSDGELVDHSYIECTDICTGEKFAIPKNGARLPSSLGMATGNTRLEAVLYGLYEVLEHDISASWLTTGLSRELRQVNMDPAVISDESLRLLVSDLTSRGHEVHFFNLLNQYEIPTILSAFYEADRQLVFTGIACRLDLQDAMTHSFHEALNGHYVSYFGSRDDRRGFEQGALAKPRRFLEQFLGSQKRFSHERKVGPLTEQVEELVDRIRKQGAEHVFAIDLSPRNEFGLAVVKMVVPGMERRRFVHRPASFYRKCFDIKNLVAQYATGIKSNMHEQWPLEKLRAEFAPPLQRLFKA